MATTLQQLQAKRDEIIARIGVRAIRRSDGTATEFSDDERALALIEELISEQSGATGSRVGLAQHSRGLGPSGPQRGGGGGW